MKRFAGGFWLFLVIANAADLTSMDSAHGRRLFVSQNCIECHRLNGEGGKSASDLGRIIDRGFTPALLAGTMWNHAPAMWNAFREQHIFKGDIGDQDAADLFAAFYAANFFDMPSDARRGKLLFSAKACAECHASGGAARPVRDWKALSSPVALVAAMWNHGGQMRGELSGKGIKWPELTGPQIADLLIYLRNLPDARQPLPTLNIRSGSVGVDLFQSKDCARCHKIETLRTGGMTLDDIAAALWNHADGRHGAPANVPVLFTESEMSDLLGYVWAGQFFAGSGNAARGAKVFASRRCAHCHGAAGGNAPDLSRASSTVNGITMVAALWRHGPAMLAEMKSKGIAWPAFRADEMPDLIAYLNARRGK